MAGPYASEGAKASRDGADTARILMLYHALDLDRSLQQIGPPAAGRDDAPIVDLQLASCDPDLVSAGFARRRFLVYGPA